MAMINKALRSMLGKFTKHCFTEWERLGLHILPVSYYSPIPEMRKLRDDIWKCSYDLIGISMNEDSQLKLLQDFSSLYGNEFNNLPLNETSEIRYYVYNGNFGAVDGEIYYSMIRHFKPRKIIEVGAGFSTLLAIEAIMKNKEEGYNCELMGIDPYPSETLMKAFQTYRNSIRFSLIEREVQELEPSMLTTLGENDILFIDSTHVVRIGGDVVYLYLRVLPRLNKGVLIHSHDVFLPLEYPKEWVFKMHRFWSEQYLLQGFLTFNNNFEVVWAGSYMNLKYPDKLEAALRSYKRGETFPGSFWIRRIR
ncbi:class I SAM-dependent methyltransferase [Candidatus Bathyarchaeota archaeon]|nr:class I SAM-dependent methyltransferase [Candidatus Bathyarchaeota archaeon]